jgi:hypothetical protein
MKSLLTNCSACGKEVAKSAKSCPHCGEKLKISGCMNGCIWTLFAVFICLYGLARSCDIIEKQPLKKKNVQLTLIGSTKRN